MGHAISVEQHMLALEGALRKLGYFGLAVDETFLRIESRQTLVCDLRCEEMGCGITEMAITYDMGGSCLVTIYPDGPPMVSFDRAFQDWISSRYR